MLWLSLPAHRPVLSSQVPLVLASATVYEHTLDQGRLREYRAVVRTLSVRGAAVAAVRQEGLDRSTAAACAQRECGGECSAAQCSAAQCPPESKSSSNPFSFSNVSMSIVSAVPEAAIRRYPIVPYRRSSAWG